MTNTEIFKGLNPEQERAVAAVRGPVCILAGAGSGKTTTITRRIANQVASGAFSASQILPVTFTTKTAGEMRSRLNRLGVDGVWARTFHAAALAQLRALSSDVPQEILESKVIALRQIGNTLPKPYRFRPASDLAQEIEWAKNNRIDVSTYPSRLNGHEPPIPADLMVGVYRRYERGKQKRHQIDFEDVLELAIQMFQTDDDARERFASRYHAFTVDEYQDVNLLQQILLQEWMGERDDLCVVGDDYQSIYGFTGATPDYLLAMPSRFPRTIVVRLESNYRSTSEVLDIANRLVPKLGGAEKVLRATKEGGPEPVLRAFSRPMDEVRFICDSVRALHQTGVPFEEMAVLYRLNFRSEDYEVALADKGIPYQVKDGAFLNRATARPILGTLTRSASTDVASQVRRLAEGRGYLEDVPEGLGEQELTRQKDLARFIKFAEDFDDGRRTGADFVKDLQGRFGPGEGRGVNLLTYHRAKGLEFDAVFLPRLEDGELPFKRSRSTEAIAEERRLFYVGITRARTHLTITWVSDSRRRRSPFVGELETIDREHSSSGPAEMRRAKPRDVVTAEVGKELKVSGGFRGQIIEITETGVTLELDGGAALHVPFGESVTADGKTRPLHPPSAPARVSEDNLLLKELKAWRLQRARGDGVPAYVVFHDSALREIAAVGPATVEELGGVGGVGPVKLERYGAEIIRLLQKLRSTN